MKKDRWPKTGDFVICTVVKVHSYGAFVKLDEYEGKEGMIHVSEVATGWIKNIKDYVREGQKIVAKVLNVNKAKGHIDLSLKRVTNQQRKIKIQNWKREQKSKKLIERVVKKLKKGEKDRAMIEQILKKKDNDIYSIFEDAILEGKDVLKKAGIPEEYIDVLYQEITENVVPPTVKIRGVLKLTTMKPNGIEDIKEALSKIKSDDKSVSVKFLILMVGKFCIRLSILSETLNPKAL